MNNSKLLSVETSFSKYRVTFCSEIHEIGVTYERKCAKSNGKTWVCKVVHMPAQVTAFTVALTSRAVAHLTVIDLGGANCSRNFKHVKS